MNWLTKLFQSSVGNKLLMSLTGLFLCSFLLVHVSGNFLLFKDDGGDSFNKYAYFMTHNPIIKFMSYGLYSMILLHAVKGILIALTNKAARPINYAVQSSHNVSWASKNMALLGSVIFIFLGIHMYNFWGVMHFGEMPTQMYDGYDEPVKDLYTLVSGAFQNPLLVAFYVLSMAGLSFHLMHGFASGFQSLGLNHGKYTPFINIVSIGFGILIPIAFAAMPIYFLLMA